MHKSCTRGPFPPHQKALRAHIRNALDALRVPATTSVGTRGDPMLRVRPEKNDHNSPVLNCQAYPPIPFASSACWNRSISRRRAIALAGYPGISLTPPSSGEVFSPGKRADKTKVNADFSNLPPTSSAHKNYTRIEVNIR